jgi:hypothetical protein
VFDVLPAHAWSAKHAKAATPKQTPQLSLLFLAPSGASSRRRRRLTSSTSPDLASMEEDDEFGDLYMDILIPTHTPQSTSS